LLTLFPARFLQPLYAISAIFTQIVNILRKRASDTRREFERSQNTLISSRKDSVLPDASTILTTDRSSHRTSISKPGSRRSSTQPGVVPAPRSVPKKDHDEDIIASLGCETHQLPLLNTVLRTNIAENDFTSSLPDRARENATSDLLMKLFSSAAKMEDLFIIIDDAQCKFLSVLLRR
jgi:hypothetical protein